MENNNIKLITDSISDNSVNSFENISKSPVNKPFISSQITRSHCTFQYTEDYWEKSPKTGYTYANSLTYNKNLEENYIIPNMSRQSLRNSESVIPEFKSNDNVVHQHQQESQYSHNYNLRRISTPLKNSNSNLHSLFSSFNQQVDSRSTTPSRSGFIQDLKYSKNANIEQNKNNNSRRISSDKVLKFSQQDNSKTSEFSNLVTNDHFNYEKGNSNQHKSMVTAEFSNRHHQNISNQGSNYNFKEPSSNTADQQQYFRSPNKKNLGYPLKSVSHNPFVFLPALNEENIETVKYSQINSDKGTGRFSEETDINRRKGSSSLSLIKERSLVDQSCSPISRESGINNIRGIFVNKTSEKDSKSYISTDKEKSSREKIFTNKNSLIMTTFLLVFKFLYNGLSIIGGIYNVLKNSLMYAVSSVMSSFSQKTTLNREKINMSINSETYIQKSGALRGDGDITRLQFKKYNNCCFYFLLGLILLLSILGFYYCFGYNQIENHIEFPYNILSKIVTYFTSFFYLSTSYFIKAFKSFSNFEISKNENDAIENKNFTIPIDEILDNPDFSANNVSIQREDTSDFPTLPINFNPNNFLTREDHKLLMLEYNNLKEDWIKIRKDLDLQKEKLSHVQEDNFNMAKAFKDQLDFSVDNIEKKGILNIQKELELFQNKHIFNIIEDYSTLKDKLNKFDNLELSFNDRYAKQSNKIQEFSEELYVLKKEFSKYSLDAIIDLESKQEAKITTQQVVLDNLSSKLKFMEAKFLEIQETSTSCISKCDKVALNLNEHLQNKVSSILDTNDMEAIKVILTKEVDRKIEKDVKVLIQQSLDRYDADKTGKVDFALESSGGSIISTRCSETYKINPAQTSLFGIPLWYSYSSPRTVIQPGSYPGQCWPFAGDKGYLLIELATEVWIEEVSLEHMHVNLSIFENIYSAPKLFTVLGLQNETDINGFSLGNFTFRYDGDPLQTFPVQGKLKQPFKHVELRILSNHGHPNYTCIYRFRVHGRAASFIHP